MNDEDLQREAEKIARKEEVRLAIVGLTALIDEATGYQKVRPKDDLRKIDESMGDADV